MKVLIVEDDVALGCALSRAFRSAGHEVEAVADGERAIERLGANRPDVLLTDWLLPRVDGISVIRFAHALPDRPRLLMLSALHQPEARVHALRAGADAFFSKPTPLATLLHALEPHAPAAPPVSNVVIASRLSIGPADPSGITKLVAGTPRRGLRT